MCLVYFEGKIRVTRLTGRTNGRERARVGEAGRERESCMMSISCIETTTDSNSIFCLFVWKAADHQLKKRRLVEAEMRNEAFETSQRP